MQNYKPGTEVPLIFSLLDESGGVLAPLSMRFRILNEADIVMQDWLTLALPTTSEVNITISAAFTTLLPPATRALRTVELEVTTGLGTLALSESVLIQGITALAFGINTFQTYSQALLMAEDSVPSQIPGWCNYAREEREKALIEAFSRIMLLPIENHFSDEQSMLQFDTTFVRNFGPNLLRYLSPVQLAALYPPLLAALKKAQLIEADDILNDDPIAKARKSGITSMTVGDSSNFFKAVNPLNLPICERALVHLQRWVRFTARISRR